MWLKQLFLTSIKKCFKMLFYHSIGQELIKVFRIKMLKKMGTESM